MLLEVVSLHHLSSRDATMRHRLCHSWAVFQIPSGVFPVSYYCVKCKLYVINNNYNIVYAFQYIKQTYYPTIAYFICYSLLMGCFHAILLPIVQWWNIFWFHRFLYVHYEGHQATVIRQKYLKTKYFYITYYFIIIGVEGFSSHWAGQESKSLHQSTIPTTTNPDPHPMSNHSWHH